MTAILATVIFCAVGPVVGGKCENGAPPLEWSVHILHGTGESGCDEKDRGTYAFCAWRMAELRSVVEIKDKNRVVFRLKPDGTTEHAADFNPDLAAKAFWFSVFGAYPPAARIWSTP